MVVLHAHHGFVVHGQLGRVSNRREPVGPVQERRGPGQQQTVDIVRVEKKRIYRRIFQGTFSRGRLAYPYDPVIGYRSARCRSYPLQRYLTAFDVSLETVR